MGCNNQSSLFGSSEKYIKFLNGDLVAIEGANTIDKQILNDLRIPYSQLLRGRVVLKAGQVDYLLNHLGLGDNATFLSIAARYNTKSKIETDNYVQYNYSNDLSKNLYFAQLLMLTGNSTHRIPQLYLTNPNPNYEVTLDVMVAVIDNTYTYFNDTVNQSGLSFTGLEVGDIHTYIINESIVINDKSSPVKPLIYFNLVNINSIERTGAILTIDDLSYGTIFLKFLTETDAIQAFSLLNYVLENPGVDIDTLDPLTDAEDPILYFRSLVDGTGDYISFNGMTDSVPYDTTFGLTFSTSMSLANYSGTIDRNQLILSLVDNIIDNRDGTMSMTASNIVISGSSSVTSIITVGTYSITFDFSDLAQNYLDGVVVNLDITA
jgi:hypothetical protein